MKILITLFFRLRKLELEDAKYPLVEEQCRLDIRKYSFSERKINEWNTLSTDHVKANSMNIKPNCQIYRKDGRKSG